MIQKTKSLLLLAILSANFLLGGCFGGNNTTTTGSPSDTTRVIGTATPYDKYEFTITIPREWDIIESKDFTNEVPKETAMMFRNNIKNEDFTANVNIVKNQLLKTRETLDYAKQVLAGKNNGLLNFKETKRDLVQIQIGGKKVDTYIAYFQGKQKANTEVINFTQTYAVKDTTAYIILGAVSPNESSNNIKAVEDIIKSFTVK